MLVDLKVLISDFRFAKQCLKIRLSEIQTHLVFGAQLYSEAPKLGLVQISALNWSQLSEIWMTILFEDSHVLDTLKVKSLYVQSRPKSIFKTVIKISDISGFQTFFNQWNAEIRTMYVVSILHSWKSIILKKVQISDEN